ncbi:putative ferric-chelate reductase 1 [Dissostichus eleginoides]|uniref:Ferric-chelate reductase 1 n=1 Tax=Dissostichus eleginoides TaxID=100907 RepID=A0AAD9F6E9_DISEL|nr:putative ferric-chelate reductase 1 [Dissostichus eleginoides]
MDNRLVFLTALLVTLSWMSVGATTAAPTTAAATQAPPIKPNTTVTELMTAINRADCGTGQLCAAQPSNCDPSTSSSCFFLAAKQSSGRNFDFGLSGESDGYLAATLSLDNIPGGNDTTYVCAKNGSVVQFFGALLNNDILTVKELDVGSVKGKIDGNKIQCTFSATVPAPITRTKIFAVAISTGAYNSADGTLGSPNFELKSDPLNLAIPAVVGAATTAAPTTAAATQAPPIKPNTTVTELMTAINRADCGTGQLCAAQPSNCDPSTSSSCFFLAAKQSSGRNFDFGLSGESDGYLAATLSLDNILGGNDTTYVCAKNGSVVQFFGALLNNDILTVKELNVGSVKGKIDGNKIQCTFSATVPAPITRTKIFAVAISTGTFNSANGTLGSPNFELKSDPLNLATPAVVAAATTAAPTTAAPTTAAATQAPPIKPNTTVTELMTAINRAGCGTGQLCAAQPSNCDPSTSSSCFFLAAKQSSGRNFDFGLSGESDGYLAATLSLDNILGGNDTTYVCAKNGSVVQFFGALLNNDILTVKELNVGSVKGKIDGNKIQCTFSATVPAPITRTKIFAVAISTGAFNSADGTLGSPTVQFKSDLLNLANASANVTNVASHAITIQQSLTQALLITVGVLVLTVL